MSTLHVIECKVIIAYYIYRLDIMHWWQHQIQSFSVQNAIDSIHFESLFILILSRGRKKK